MKPHEGWDGHQPPEYMDVCANCKFWDQEYGNTTDKMVSSWDSGFCHFEAPKVFQNGRNDIETHRPKIQANDGCGQFSPDTECLKLRREQIKHQGTR